MTRLHSGGGRRALLLAAAMLAAGVAQAGSMPSPAEVAAHRQESLDDMLTEDYQPALIANLRRSCALGLEPAHVVEARSQGAYFTPDATDSCVIALLRTARDRNLPEFYGKLAVELGGNAEGHEKLPRAIGAALLKGVDIQGSGPTGNLLQGFLCGSVGRCRFD